MFEKRLLVQFSILNQPQKFSDETHCDTTALNLIQLFAGEKSKCNAHQCFQQGHKRIAILPDKQWLFGDDDDEKDKTFYLIPNQNENGSTSQVTICWYECKQSHLSNFNEKTIELAQFESVLPSFPKEKFILRSNDNFILEKVKYLCDYNFQFTNFFEQFKLAEKSELSIIRSFFNKSEKSLVFYLNFDEVYHSLVIEKIVENNHIGWVIYQSWLDEFSLFEWLGLSSSHEDFSDSNMNFKMYGRGKLLNAEEIHNFMDDIAELPCLLKLTHVRIEIFPHNVLNNLKNHFPQNNLIQLMSSNLEPLSTDSLAISTTETSNNNLSPTKENASHSEVTAPGSPNYTPNFFQPTKPNDNELNHKRKGQFDEYSDAKRIKLQNKAIDNQLKG